MFRNRAIMYVAVAAAAVLGVALNASPALASADRCNGPGLSLSCVAVNGTNLHVNWIKSRVDVYAWICEYGHSQVLINGRHYANSPGGDKDWCVPGYPGRELTTGPWNVNRNYPKGTKICSKFWVHNIGYRLLGNACVTVG